MPGLLSYMLIFIVNYYYLSLYYYYLYFYNYHYHRYYFYFCYNTTFVNLQILPTYYITKRKIIF